MGMRPRYAYNTGFRPTLPILVFKEIIRNDGLCQYGCSLFGTGRPGIVGFVAKFILDADVIRLLWIDSKPLETIIERSA